jgi:hypothetical protein
MVARAKSESRLVYTRLVHGGNTEKNQTLSRNSVFYHQNHRRSSFKDGIATNTWIIFFNAFNLSKDQNAPNYQNAPNFTQ